MENRELHMQQDIAKSAMDGVAVSVTVATVMNWLPAVAAIFTIIWTAIRIWETDTVQRMRRKW